MTFVFSARCIKTFQKWRHSWCEGWQVEGAFRVSENSTHDSGLEIAFRWHLFFPIEENVSIAFWQTLAVLYKRTCLWKKKFSYALQTFYFQFFFTSAIFKGIAKVDMNAHNFLVGVFYVFSSIFFLSWVTYDINAFRRKTFI